MRCFLLHACCAPCSLAVIDELRAGYDLTVFFYNPNIFPEEEYLKRKKEIRKVCEECGVPIVDRDYGREEWQEAVRGLEKEPEGGARCSVCFRLRLEKTAAYAARRGFEWFGTTLTSGRNKRAEVINFLGHAAGEKYGVRFYEADWKKGGRQEKSRQMARERGIYRQNYCGCSSSFGERQKLKR
ncbi:MAG: epoxyqueuosine reductase QueH [Candidatus Magasanikbacteria bacterium]|nr:epoxyqueuosine reductase QueH [Candidatus Magasanikbacteria bacterium]